MVIKYVLPWKVFFRDSETGYPVILARDSEFRVPAALDVRLVGTEVPFRLIREDNNDIFVGTGLVVSVLLDDKNPRTDIIIIGDLAPAVMFPEPGTCEDAGACEDAAAC